MTEKLGRVVRSQWEDIWVLLDRGQEEPHLELRLHHHGLPPEPEGACGTERVGLPVRLLPDLLHALTQAQDQLRAGGVEHVAQALLLPLQIGQTQTVGRDHGALLGAQTLGALLQLLDLLPQAALP